MRGVFSVKKSPSVRLGETKQKIFGMVEGLSNGRGNLSRVIVAEERTHIFEHIGITGA